jgi:hypothetical protein
LTGVEKGPPPETTAAPACRVGASSEQAWLWILSLFLVGLGAKLWLIHGFGSSLPFWDQWEEARVVYVPWFEHRLSPTLLFSPHNEPRIFFTRVYDLVLLLLGQQWDNQLQIVVNAVLHCAILTALGAFMCRGLKKRYWLLVWLPLVLALALPFAWENTLAGLHSCFYFMLLFTLLTIWLLGLHPPGSAGWWCGCATAIMALFTLSSGFFAVWAVLGLVLVRVWRAPRTWRQHIPTLALWLMLTVAGVLLKAEVKHHRILQAHSVAEFVTALGNNLAWPWIILPSFTVLNLFPLAALAWFTLRSREELQPTEGMTLAIGLWVVLQGAATAYARGADGKPPAWRYMDSSSFILIADCFSIAILMQHHLRRSHYRRLWLASFCLWGIASAFGLALLTLRAWQIDIPERRLYSRAQLQNARAYLATGDVRVLDNKPKSQLPLYEGDPFAPQPLHQGDKLAEYINSNRWVRGILPACVRDPLKIIPGSVAGFATNGLVPAKPRIGGEVSWSSCAQDGAAGKGRFESLLIPRTRFPFLEFRVAGDLGQPGLSLALLDLDSGKQTPVLPREIAGGNWRTCRVKAPKGDFKIIASDESNSGWLAFQAPREVAWLPWAAAKLAGLGGVILGVGLVCALAWTILSCRSRNRNESRDRACS